MSDVWDPRLTEARNPRTEAIDRADARAIVRLMQAEDRQVPAAVEAEADRIALLIDRVVERLREGGRLLYVGAGTSGRLGVLDAAECPPTFGADPSLVQGIIAGGPDALRASLEG
ncbi:MAG: N-acetylmuramic acid 6-phosphate etherase, partial [Gemmatimonadota bacterium]